MSFVGYKQLTIHYEAIYTFEYENNVEIITGISY